MLVANSSSDISEIGRGTDDEATAGADLSGAGIVFLSRLSAQQVDFHDFKELGLGRSFGR